MGSANAWVVLKNSSRPTLRDQAKTKTVSAETKIKTAKIDLKRSRDQDRGLEDYKTASISKGAGDRGFVPNGSPIGNVLWRVE